MGKKQTQKTPPYLQLTKNIYICVCIHPYRKLVSLDLYLVLTGPHTQQLLTHSYTLNDVYSHDELVS